MTASPEQQDLAIEIEVRVDKTITSIPFFTYQRSLKHAFLMSIQKQSKCLCVAKHVGSEDVKIFRKKGRIDFQTFDFEIIKNVHRPVM